MLLPCEGISYGSDASLCLDKDFHSIGFIYNTTISDLLPPLSHAVTSKATL